MRRWSIIFFTLLLCFVIVPMPRHSATGIGIPVSANQASKAPPQSEPEGKSSTLILDAAKIALSGPSKGLEPVPFTSQNGRNGWKLSIPGGRTLPTPAISNGKIFVGGGFGSHEFYALDASTGKKIWVYPTKDDGPTAAVVQDGYVAFNTESCELEILTTDGKPVWKKWLGDPLMSMPAIANGKVYMAYPNSRGDRRHYVACFDLKTGTEHWKRLIAGEVITAPVIENGNVYLATLEGTLYCFSADRGDLAWSEKKNATSSPMVWKGQCYFSRREEITMARAGKQQTEQLAARHAMDAQAAVVSYPKTTVAQADYLDAVKKVNLPSEHSKEAADASVGFGATVGAYVVAGAVSASKGDSKLYQAYANLGEKTVSGVWSYQGSKPFVYRGALYSAMGDTLKCVKLKGEDVLWEKTFRKNDKAEPLDRTLTPPAFANGKVFLCTVFGDVLCLSATSGALLWSVNVGEPIVCQPSIAGGKVYVATRSGSLYCIETGDARDDGWLMWGARASHNGLPN